MNNTPIPAPTHTIYNPVPTVCPDSNHIPASTPTPTPVFTPYPTPAPTSATIHTSDTTPSPVSTTSFTSTPTLTLTETAIRLCYAAIHSKPVWRQSATASALGQDGRQASTIKAV